MQERQVIMLTGKQAEANQKQYGWNEIVEQGKKSIFVIFLEQFVDVLIFILIIAAVLSAWMKDVESAVVILAVIILNAVLGTVQTVKAERSLDSLKQMSAPDSTVFRDGKLCKIPSREVTVGDEVILEAGDIIPADGILMECAYLKVNESALTGESVPVEKSLEPEGDTHVFSGTFVVNGRGKYLVTDIGMGTKMGQIAVMLQNAGQKKTPLQRQLDQFGRRLAAVILVLCIIVFGVTVWRGSEVVEALIFALALAVAAIPEALSSIVTIVLAFGTQKMGREGAIVRKLQAVEGLGSVSVICSDKTGTLTKNQMTVEYLYTDDLVQPADALDTQMETVQLVIAYGVLCNDASLEDETGYGDPTELALLKLCRPYEIDISGLRETYPRLAEISFDSERKCMSTVHVFEDQPVLIVKGAVDVILKRASYWYAQDTRLELDEEKRERILRQNEQFSSQGLRVLAFAYRELTGEEINPEEDLRGSMKQDFENDLVFLGLAAMADPPREESEAAIAECIFAGIRPVMITGDHLFTASAIAKRIGLMQPGDQAMEGEKLDQLTDDQLEEMVDQISVYARVSPEHKLRIIRAWQKKGHVVSMTGDGVNDAPALKQSDIGVAMGGSGTQVARDAADMILTDDNFATIVKAVESGRNIFRNIRYSIQFLMSGNFAGILAVIYASVLALPLPFAPVHLLFINLLTDSLPAIALGLEPHRKEVMKDKPRNPQEPIMTKDFLASVGVEGLVIGIFTMVAFYIGYEEGDAALASTMAFGTLCLGRLVHGFNCKSEKAIFVSEKLFQNMNLVLAFAVGFLMITAVLVIPGLQGIFQVVSLDFLRLVVVYGLALLNFPVIQMIKFIKEKVGEGKQKW